MVAMFEELATLQLQVLFCVVVLGNPFRTMPASAAEACGTDLYARVVLTHQYLVDTASAAAMLLLVVKMWVCTAQAAAGWRRRLLRGTLLLAVALSFAASLLAVVTYHDGFRYRAGCDHDAGTGYGAGWLPPPPRLLMIGVFALGHGYLAWVAVSKN